MTSHPAIDHEHLAGDGCETVRHEDHVDHIHGDQQHAEQATHSGHTNPHVDGDACQTVQHGDHVDHMHEGHRHFQHGDHVDEH
jgi:hypothetical protein